MNVLIIEDESLTAQRLEKLLLQYDPSIQVLAQIPSVAKSIRWFSEHALGPQPDLIFMDIQLEDDIGFRIIEQTQLTIPIVFTTAYDEYTLQAFKVNSIDYLLKPIDEQELAAAIDKFKVLRQAAGYRAQLPDLSDVVTTLIQSKSAAYKERFMVTLGSKIRSVETSQIAYFFFEDKATYLTTREGQNLLVEYSLDKLGSLVDPNQFFRVNRSFLVSLKSTQTIHTFSGGKLKLDLAPKPRQEVFVSADRIPGFKEWLGK
ncbi:LytR/AlgR family response regulator transcription factor [Spirosoma endophyticum]|uniref:Two component transcriptional regulator, LytTR family n=1 Tax=Spirosoma endophyticum TaxID=662367 RepID=A0A1I1FV79_9BACT|nr:LytTR family DNA-binding domain-containing protein [Spirosoma endophyticum]SFC03234.1 two component transcriptional regulator, LytTR family [Spirosoma endophyticum]